MKKSIITLAVVAAIVSGSAMAKGVGYQCVFKGSNPDRYAVNGSTEKVIMGYGTMGYDTAFDQGPAHNAQSMGITLDMRTEVPGASGQLENYQVKFEFGGENAPATKDYLLLPSSGETGHAAMSLGNLNNLWTMPSSPITEATGKFEDAPHAVEFTTSVNWNFSYVSELVTIGTIEVLTTDDATGSIMRNTVGEDYSFICGDSTAIPNLDIDDDGVADATDQDSDGTPDAIDTDVDNDGIIDNEVVQEDVDALNELGNTVDEAKDRGEAPINQGREGGSGSMGFGLALLGLFGAARRFKK
jgi:hypothetical protein